MRTTLNIDDDVLAIVRERARAQHTDAGRVISDLARRALSALPEDKDHEEFFGFRPFPRRGAVITTELIDEIRDDLGI